MGRDLFGFVSGGPEIGHEIESVRFAPAYRECWCAWYAGHLLVDGSELWGREFGFESGLQRSWFVHTVQWLHLQFLALLAELSGE
jgi:hypothetical protein